MKLKFKKIYSSQFKYLHHFLEKNIMQKLLEFSRLPVGRNSGFLRENRHSKYIYIMQNLHGHFSGFQLFIAVACNFIKKGLWHRCFPVNFAKFLRTPFSYRAPPVAACQ